MRGFCVVDIMFRMTQKTKIFCRYGILWFEVFVLETRNVYGVEHCLITPVNGNGQEWKRYDNLLYVP